MNYLSSISFRLVLTVVITASVAFLTLGLITNNRLHKGLDEQGNALAHISENLLIERFHGEAHLARDQLDKLSQEVEKVTASASLRTNMSKAVLSGNDVAVNEALKISLKNSQVDFMIAIDEKGNIIGTSFVTNMFDVKSALDKEVFVNKIRPIITDNSRLKPFSHFSLYDLTPDLVKSFGITNKFNFGYVAIQPVFDDFGETVGGLIGFRMLKPEEPLLKKFSELAQSDVLLLSDRNIITRTDADKISNLKVSYFHKPENGDKEFQLTRSNEELFTAHCSPYHQLHICITAGSSQVTKLTNSMLEIGRGQTAQLKNILFLVAALTMLSLIAVLFIAVRHTMKGLPQLSSAANDVAKGNLNVPFKPMGIGEVRDLSIAFERMLRTLRVSTSKVHQLAYFDNVTGLANREKLQEESRKLFVINGQDTQVMMIIDLNRFKTINENYGMKTGDYVLRKTGERISHVFSFFEKHKKLSNVTIARTGADDYVIIFTSNSSKEELRKFADIIITSLAKPLKIGSSHVVIDTKVGISIYPADGEHFDELLTHTIMAVDHLAEKNIDNVGFYEPELAKEAYEKQEIETELREALKNKNLTVYYQPKISCKDGLVRGSEALVRWIHPTKNFISPAKFIPIAEAAGLIADVGRFVLERAIDETAILLAEGHKISVAVNVSALQLDDPSFADEVIALVEAKNFPTSALELEITESMAMSDPEGVRERVTKLRAKGIRFSMDDFGTGYSNLSQLGNMPIDVLKLDRSLIMDVDKDVRKQALARSILELSREYGFKTVVEGVENVGELSFCFKNDATMIQGFVFSGAVPLDRFRPFLQLNEAGKNPFAAKFEEAKALSSMWDAPVIASPTMSELADA